MPQIEESGEHTQHEKQETAELKKFEVDGIVPVIETGDVLPHFANKSRGKYIKHNELSKEEILELRREQNREAARRMRRKKAQQRAFLEEQINKINDDINAETDANKVKQLKETLDQLQKSREEVVAIQNRSSNNKKNKRQRSSPKQKPESKNNEPPQKKQKLAKFAPVNDNLGIPTHYQPQAQLRHPQFQIIQPLQATLPTGFRRNNFIPPPLMIKQKVSPPNGNHPNHNGQNIIHPIITPILTPMQMSMMNSPQMFSYHSPQSLGSSRWLISPFKPRSNATPSTQISPNMNFVYTQISPCNLNANVNNNTNVKNDKIVKDESDGNNDIDVPLLQDKNVGTNELCSDIGIGVNPKHKCGICDKLLICPDHLLEYNKGKEVKCFECDEIFENKEMLQTHIKHKHKTILCNLESLFGVQF